MISADGELQASDKLARAAEAMAHTPGALQLRLLETIVSVAAEKNSTLVLPFPVELLRFLEHNTTAHAGQTPPQTATPQPQLSPEQIADAHRNELTQSPADRLGQSNGDSEAHGVTRR